MDLYCFFVKKLPIIGTTSRRKLDKSNIVFKHLDFGFILYFLIKVECENTLKGLDSFYDKRSPVKLDFI